MPEALRFDDLSVNRRHLIGGAAGIGALMALGGMPATAQDGERAFNGA